MLKIRVVIIKSDPNDDYFDFDLILPGGFVREIRLDEYAIRQYRSASLSDIIEHQAQMFADDMGYATDDIVIEYKRS